MSLGKTSKGGLSGWEPGESSDTRHRHLVVGSGVGRPQFSAAWMPKESQESKVQPPSIRGAHRRMAGVRRIPRRARP